VINLQKNDNKKQITRKTSLHPIKINYYNPKKKTQTKQPFPPGQLLHSPNCVNNGPNLPIGTSNHPLEQSILQTHKTKISDILQLANIHPEKPISSLDDSKIYYITHYSFYQLVKYGSTINDSIIQTFLSYLKKTDPNIYSLDTNFYQDLISHGWHFAYQKYFLHSNSFQHAKNTKNKLTLLSPIIVIPLHIGGSHWVSLTRRIISNKTFFFYADDLNNPTTATNVKNQFIASVTSSLYNPPDSE